MLPLFAGLDTRNPSPVQGDGWARIAENIIAIDGHHESAHRIRDGFTAIAYNYPEFCFGLFSWYDSDHDLQTIYASGPNRAPDADGSDGRCGFWIGSTRLTLASANPWWTGARQVGPVCFTRWRNQIFACDGYYNYRIDLDVSGAAKLFPMGAEAPTAAPVLAEGAAGSLDGTYSYVYQYVNTTLNQRSDPSDAGTITVSSKKVNLTLTECPDSSYDSIDLFRTRTDGARYLKVGRYASTTSITGENADDGDLGAEVGLAGDNISSRMPPVRVLHELPDGRMMGANDTYNDLPRHIYISYDADHPTEFPTENTIEIGDRTSGEIVSACPFGDDTLIVCTDGLYILATHNLDVQERWRGIGGSGRWCCCETPQGAIVVNQDGVYLFTGYRVVRISDPIKGIWDTVDKSHLNWVVCKYDSRLQHVLIAVSTTDGALENDTILCLDTRTLSRMDRYSHPAPRWSTWPYCRPEAAVVVDPHEGTDKLLIVAYRRGVLAKLDYGSRNDNVLGSFDHRYTYDGTFTSPLPEAQSGSIVGVNVVVTSGSRRKSVSTVIGISGSVLLLSPPLTLSVGDTYQLGAIPYKLRTKEVSFGRHRNEKLWHELELYTEQE